MLQTFFLVAGGASKSFNGTFEDYKAFLLAQRDMVAKPDNKPQKDTNFEDKKIAKDSKR
jgi:hypothetical protein